MKNEGGLKGKSAQMSQFGTKCGDKSPVRPQPGLKTCKIFQVFILWEEFNHLIPRQDSMMKDVIRGQMKDFFL